MRRSAVLLACSTLALALAGCGSPTASVTPATDLSAAVMAAPELNVFGVSVGKTEVDGMLRRSGPYTVFAPTDAAFASLPERLSVAELLKPENAEILTSLLEGHVVQGRFLVEDLYDGQRLEAVNGLSIRVSRNGNDVTLNNDVKITTPDRSAGNGVLHVVSAPILAGSTGPSR